MSCKTMNIDLANVPPVPIQIGVAGENAFRTITFDASTWGADFPDATYTVVYKRSDGYIYPVLVNAAADAIVWSPTDTDTAVSGNGQIEVRLLDGETIGKTIVMQTFVAPSLSGDESEPSTPAPDWVNDVAADADRAEAAVEHYPQIRNGELWVWNINTEQWEKLDVSGGSDSIVYVTEADSLHVSMSASEIQSAVSSGKFPVLKIGNLLIPFCTMTDDGDAAFSVTTADNSTLSAVTILVDDNRNMSINNATSVQSVNGMTGAVTLSASDVGAYVKPSGGIPASDLAQTVQTSLGKADTALQTAPVTSVNGMTGDVVITVDSALSTTSQNPVQNKVVKAALDAKADASALAAKQDALTAGQNITISGNTISAYADSAEIAADVTDWLDNNVTPVGSAVVVDSSLSVSGAAADAKETGDAIAKVYEDIGVNEPTPTPETVVQPTGSVQGYVTQEGVFATSTATKTFYFKGEPNTVYRMHANDSVRDGVSQYIAEYPSVPSFNDVSANFERISVVEDVSITTGNTAGYICFGHGYETTDANMTVYAKTVSETTETLGERVASLEIAVSNIDSGSAKMWGMELEFGSLNQSVVPNESKNLFTADNMTNGCDVSDSFTKFARTGFYYAAKKSISFNQDLIGCVYEYDADFAFIRVDLISSRTVKLDENTRFVKVSVQPSATAASVTWSRGSFSDASVTNRIVSGLIALSAFDFVLMRESDSTLFVEFYDSSMNKIGNGNAIRGMFINKTMILDRFTATVSGKTVNNVAYVKVSAKNFANTDIDTAYAPFVGLCSNAKLPKITVTTYAEKAVFKNKGVYGSTIQCVIPVTANDGHIYCTSILLRLPMNYSHIGEPSKLIFFKTGSDGYTNIRVSEFNYKDYLMYWVDSGYAVADCYGCTSKYPDMNPFGMPTNLCAYSAMWDFVKTHYNIDVDGFYLSCKSLGGMSANLMLANRNLPIRAAALFAPALINTKVCFGYYKNQRLAFIDDAGLEGDLSYIEQDGRSIGSGLTVDYQNEAFKTIVKNNHDKLLGFLPLETGVVNKTLAELLDIEINTSGSMDGVIRYMQTPTRIWVAPDDTDTPYIGIESFVKSAQNGHSPVTIRTMPSGTGGHHSVDSAANAPKTTVTTRFGVTYSDFPIAYVEALQFLERY